MKLSAKEILVSIFPPFILLGLTFVQIDFASIFIWFFAFIVLLYSVISIVKKISQGAEKKLLIRPTASILIIIFSYYMVKLSAESSIAYGKYVSDIMQLECCRSNSCSPPQIIKWRISETNEIYSYYGRYGTKYKISLRVSPNYDNYDIRVRLNIDKSIVYTGGISACK